MPFESKTEKHQYEVGNDISHDMTKKQNVRYWDGIDALTEEYVKNIAKAGNIHIHAIEDETSLKQLTEAVISAIRAEFPEAHYPFVDENY